MATPVFSYGDFIQFFSQINIADHTSKKFNLVSFCQAACELRKPGSNYNSNLMGYVKYWAASWLKENGKISDAQYQAYLSGKNKI